MKERNEIEVKYTWDKERIYSENTFENDYNEVLSQIDVIKTYAGKMNTATRLYEALCLYYNNSRRIDKLYTYASLKLDEDTRNSQSNALLGRVSNLNDKFNVSANFLVPNILKISKTNLSKMYEENPKLLEYKHQINQIMRYKKHTLSLKEEKILSQVSRFMGKSSDTYKMLSNSDITFENLDSGDFLNETNYILYMKSSNRNIRKEAFEKLYKTYKQFSNTIASTLFIHVKERVTISSIKKYNSSLEEALYEDELNIKVYDNLINTVNKNLDVVYKYYNIKKKLLNINELHLYDIYAPLIKDYEKKYPYEEAFQIVKEALKPLGEEYQNILKEAETNRWIDVYPNIGKRSGGYSGGSYDTSPYILLNYQDKYDDMSTLSHELGHSVHTYYSNKNSYQDSGYSIFVAEVASTVNELLLAKYLLKASNSKEEKKYILNNLLELYRATIFRQTMFAEFEKEIYMLVEKDETLTSEVLNNIYYNLNKKYFGSNVYVDDEIKYEWMRIPHFYYHFYVYKYATGLSAATYIVENIIEKNQSDKYINFLKCGTTKNPIDSLKCAGVDLTKPEVITSAINTFNKYLDEFISLFE